MVMPLEDRRDLWRWKYAYRSFANCSKCCEYVMKNKLTADSPIYYGLSSAVFIAYARPFSRSYGLEKLPDSLVPSQFKAMHELMINARHKVYAHTDADKILVWGGEPTIQVLVTNELNGDTTIEAVEVTPSPAGWKPLKALSDILMNKSHYYAQKVATRNKRYFPKGLGSFHISIEEGADPFVPMVKTTETKME